MLNDVHDKSIDEQGERMVPAFHKGALVYGEHITRYESVAEVIKDKEILDIASGSGYGSYIMAEGAKKVYGVDIDEESVKYAQRNYKRENIEYKVGSAEEIPLPDNAVDVVVTFETIEHIKNYQKFMAEIKRVLRPGGVAVVSTPNDPEFPEGNHFHLHEFTHEELRTMIKKYFKNMKFSYQYTWLYTAILNDSAAEKEWDKPLRTLNVAAVPKEKAIYFTAICSDEDIDKLELKELSAISEHWSARHQQDLEQQRQKERKELEATKDREIKQLQERLQAIYRSKGWRLLSIAYTVKSKLLR